MRTETETSFNGSNKRSEDLAVPETTVTLVTAIVGIVVGLTFLFGFGNVLALGLRLGVPIWVAPLVAPAVDLSVVALLLGTRHLALHGGPVDVLKSARRLLIFSSMVTLALNVAEPLIERDYGKAAFDAVGPLLLIGWSEVGPGLLQAIRTAGPSAEPAHDQRTPSRANDRRLSAHQDLLHRARAEDAIHWQHHHRPISADTLRKRLHIGATTARSLVTQLRTDTNARFDTPHNKPGSLPTPA